MWLLLAVFGLLPRLHSSPQVPPDWPLGPRSFFLAHKSPRIVRQMTPGVIFFVMTRNVEAQLAKTFSTAYRGGRQLRP